MELIGCTYNVMSTIPEPIRFQGQNDRMLRIPSCIATMIDSIERLDFIVVQESMSSESHDILSTGLYNLGFVHRTEQLVGELSRFQVVQGGLVLFSRFPIVRYETKVFKGVCSREDCLSAKGCLYARVEKFGQPFNIFSIHVQSWESETSRNIRRMQFLLFTQFIEAQAVPTSEPLVILGDFNMDIYSQQKQLSSILNVLNAEMLPRHAESHPFTSDPSTNELMGIDDFSSYVSPSYPSGCESIYLKTGRCVCCPCEWLDYALNSKSHVHINKDVSYMRAIPLKSDPFSANLTWTHRRKIRDLSDHYPVLAKYVFPELIPKSHVQHSITFQKPFKNRLIEPLVYNLTFFLVLAGFIAIFALFIIWTLIKV